MKRLITYKTWLCRLTLVLGCLAIAMAVHAASITVDGINYTTASGGKATIAKYTIIKATAESPADTLFYTGDIVIPEKFTYEGVEYTVVATAANAFLDCKNLTSVQLPATCITIGRNSFKGCTKLATSPIPMTATSVGSGVFNGCSSLEEVTIMSGWSKPVSEEFANCPNLKRLIIAEGSSPLVMKIHAFGSTTEARSALRSIEYIYMGRNVDASAYLNNEQPFHNMTNLKTLVIGGESTTIQGTTFQGCTALNTITFNEGNKMSNIGSNAFENCTSLTSINIPLGVTVIEQNVFNNCQNLKNVTLSDGVTSIGNSAFKNTGLTSFHFPYALTTIGESAFENSKLSGDIELPGLLTAIGTQAFASTSLHGVTIPASVTDIGNGAFAPIATLASISLNGGNTSFMLDHGVLLSAAGTRLLVSAHEGNIGTSYSNATVTTIDNYGLAHAPFTTVYLPALASIGNYGFAYSDLETFTLESVVTVGVNVFMGSALNDIVIAEGRNEIPQGLCSQCTSLTSVTLPTTATNMMSNCFEGCTALEVMEIPANVNYMEPGSVPATIKELRVLNTNPPVLADGVFNENQHDVICKVAPSSVSLFENTSQWYFLRIVADESISSDVTMLGCPDGLYYATTNGDLMYRDLNGNIVNTNFNTGQHAFTLQSYKNRVYVAVAGQRFTYQDPNQPLGDGELFYVNNSNGIFYRVTVLNNVGHTPSEDPFTMSIDADENKIYISDRNVGIHEMSADATGLYGQQPFLVQNQWLPYYNDEISWGSITGGFTKDKNGIFWMSKKFNGVCLLRFTKDDIYLSGGQGKPKPYNALFKDAIIKTFYLDEENGYLYMQVQTDPYGCVPGIYRIALSRIENLVTGADVVGNENLRIADCELIDNSPIKVEGAEDSGELANVAQITGDGEYIYWSYIAPASDDEAIRRSVPLNTNNPLHHSGIKCLKAKPNDDGTMPTTVTFAVEGVEAYGVCAMNYSPYITPELEQTVEPSFNYHKDDLARVYYVEIEQVEPSTISYRILLPNGEWTEWTEYSDVLSFTENGIYRIEAFAIADGKRPSETIALEIIVDFPVQTAKPTINTEETDNAVIVTATGNGEVKLYKDGVEVENPCTIARTHVDQQFTFTATAQEEGMQISETATAIITVPAQMDMSGDIVFIAGIDNGTGSTTAGPFSIEKQGVTIEVTNGLANSSHYRFYKNNTVTITSTVGDISKVVFDCIGEDDAQYGPGGFTVEDGEYTYSGKVGTWIGSAQSVVFTASNYQVRASKVTVTIGDGPAQTATPTITTEMTDDAVIVTATGDGEVKLYKDGVEVENPCTIARTNVDQQFTFTATAQEEGKLISETVTATITVPEIFVPTFATDGVTYDEVNGFSIRNVWIQDRAHTPQDWSLLPYCNTYARTAVMHDGFIYIAHSNALTVTAGDETLTQSVIYKVDASNGKLVKKLPLTLDGEIYGGATLSCNTVGVDNFGHLYMAPFSSAMSTIQQVYMVDKETGELTLMGELDKGDALQRCDYIDLIGDITREKAECNIMSAGASSEYIFRWHAEQGGDWEGGFDGDPYLAIFDFYPETVTNWGYMPVVKMWQENPNDYSGELFFVDGFNSAPILYDVTGTMVDNFEGVNSDCLPMDNGANGICEFTLGGRHFIAFVAAQYTGYNDATMQNRACQVYICELGDGKSMYGMQRYWMIPDELGTVSDSGTRIECINVEYGTDDEGNEEVTLFIFKCYNGMGVYKITAGYGPETPQTDTPTITTEMTDNAVIVTATGDGEVKLYKDGVEVENPCTIARTSTEQRFTFTATAHEEGKLISETATLAVTVPAKQAPEDDKTTGEYNILPDGNPRMAGQGVQDHLFVRDMNGSQTVDNTVNFYDNNEQLVWIWLDDDQIYMNESVQSLTPIAYNSAGDLYNEITYNSLQCDIYLPSGFSLTQIIDNNGQQIKFAQGDRLPSTSNLIWAKKNEIKTIDGIQYDVYSLIIYNVNNYGSHFSSKNATMYQSQGALKKDDAPLFGLGLIYDGVSASSSQLGDMIIANQVFTTREASVAEWGANESMFYYATGGNNMAQLFNLYNRVKLVVDGQIPEQTAAPVINGTIDHVTGTYTIALSPGEDNSVIYYRYINYSDDEWSEWMEYVNPIQFTEQGMYRIEAYAVAPGKQSSVHVYYDFMNSGPVYTATPTITAEETDNAVIVTATGDGEVKLYLDGVEVENPYVIPKQEQTMTYNFTATAQKEGYNISNEASLTVTVPGYGSGITVYVKADRAPHLFSWVPDGNGSWINPLGDWPGSVMSNIMTVNRVQYYTYTFDPFPSVNIILNNGSGGFGNQTGDFVNITEDAYFVYNGGGLAYGVIPPTVYGNPTGEYAFYVNTDHWSKVNAVLDGVSYPMTLVGTDGAGYEVYKWENNMITAPSTITFNDGAGHQVVDASGHVYSSDYVKGGYYIYTFFASKQYASLDMPTVITYEGEDQRPVLEDCAITLKSSNEVWNSYNDVSFDITGTYFNPAARQGRALYSVDGGEWVEFTSLLNSEQRFAQNVTLSFNPDVTRHTIRLAAQDLSGAYSAIVTVLEVTDAKALLCYDLPELEYTGEPLTFEPWIYDPYSYQQLTLGEDYTVTFSNNVNVGPASMNVQAIYPAYIGETTFTYAIIPHPISGEAYVVGGPFYYNGNAFTPAVVVIDDLLGELTPGEDYTVTYIDNVEIGEAIAIVEGIGRCTGLIDVPFEILDPPMNERDWNIIKLFYSQYQNDQFVWNVDDPVSAKYNSGLTVENERVTGIELPEQGLEGGFPTMLLSLDELRTLDLSYNNLSGDAASDMAQYAAAEGITATDLQNLFINNNEFTGNVGQMAALFGSLMDLNVSANHFDKVYPMVNPSVNLSLSEQLLEMDADITPGIESLITSIPTICLYDHAAQTFLTNLSAQLTDQAQSPVWTMDLSFNNGAFNMYTSSPYRGLNGQILDGNTWLNSSWYNEQLLKVKFIFAPGDANINGPVDITDLQAMVNYIFGEYNRPFNYTAANLNNDNTVNVQDVVGEANLLLSMDLTMGTSGPGRAPVLETTTPQASLYWQDGVLYLNTSVPVAALDIVNDVNGDIKWNVANRGMVVKTARGTQGEHTVIYSLGDAVIPPGLTAIATTTSHGATVVAAKLSDTDAELVKIKLNDGLTRLTDVPTDGNVQCQLDGNSLIINSGNPLEDVNIGIYTIDGKVIADKHLSHLDSGQTLISMSDFAYSNGYLIIVVRNGRQVIATQKLTQIK